MQSLTKTLLAIALGLGFQALDLHAKPTVAFLGLSADSDPQVSGEITRRIQWDLTADTALSAISAEDVAMLFGKGILREPEASAADLPKLAKGLGAQYYAFGKLEPIAVESKRGKWTPWSIKVKWTQGLKLRILDGSNGKVVFDGLVQGELPKQALFMGPDGEWGKMSPLERDGWLKTMAALVSTESAKTVSKVITEKEAGSAAKPAGS